jgi:ribosomal protein S18 acetylase RimI-like enzyme
MIHIRPIKPGEGNALFSMVLALAESHNLVSHLEATPAMYEKALFAEQPIVGAFLAEIDGELAGCAVWHRSYSTFRGVEVMYLEDLSVLPKFRRRGIARALLKYVAVTAIEKNYPSIYWLVMEWNKEASALYESIGAEIEVGTSFCRIHGPALKALAS